MPNNALQEATSFFRRGVATIKSLPKKIKKAVVPSLEKLERDYQKEVAKAFSGYKKLKVSYPGQIAQRAYQLARARPAERLQVFKGVPEAAWKGIIKPLVKPLGEIPVMPAGGFFQPPPTEIKTTGPKPWQFKVTTKPREEPPIKLKEFFEPKEYIGGKVGRAISGTIYDIIGSLTPEHYIRAIPKFGYKISPKGAFKGALSMLGISQILKKLNTGKDLTKEEAAVVGIMGAVIGAVEPRPLSSASTTELGAARKRLAKNYGFELKDFSNSEILKRKATKVWLDIHPDRHPENPAAYEKPMAQFNRDFEIVSSAKPPSLKLPNILEWLKTLWSKPKAGEKALIKVKQPPVGMPPVPVGAGPLVPVGPPPPPSAIVPPKLPIGEGRISPAEQQRITQMKISEAETKAIEEMKPKLRVRGALEGLPLEAAIPTPLEEAIRAKEPRIKIEPEPLVKVRPPVEKAPAIPTELEPFKFQDVNQEKIIHMEWDKGNPYRHDLEGAGDIFRELTKRRSDFGYITEKVNRIDRLLTGIETGKLHPDDSLEAALKQNADRLKQLESLWNKQPITNEAQGVARDLNIALIKGDYKTARTLLEQIKSPDFYAQVTKEVKPPVEKVPGVSIDVAELDRAVAKLPKEPVDNIIAKIKEKLAVETNSLEVSALRQELKVFIEGKKMGATEFPNMELSAELNKLTRDGVPVAEALERVLSKPSTEEALGVAKEARILAEARKEVKEEFGAGYELKTGGELQNILKRMVPTKEGEWSLPRIIDGEPVKWDEIGRDLGFPGKKFKEIELTEGENVVVDADLYNMFVQLKGGQPGARPTRIKVRKPRISKARIKKWHEKLPSEAFKVVQNYLGEVTGVVVEPSKKVRAKIISRELQPKIKEEREFLKSLGKAPSLPKQVDKIARMIRKATDDALKKKIATRTTEAGNEVPIIRGGQTIGRELVDDASKLKDIRSIEKIGVDYERNFEKVFGDRIGLVKREILNPYLDAKTERSDFEAMKREELTEKIVEKYGIRKGSKESAAVQAYGEKEMSLEDLQKGFPEKWEGIVKADEWFRKEYDALLLKVNKIRVQIGKKPIEAREDYYRHFWELSGFEGFVNVFRQSYEVDPLLVGVSEYTQPISRWLSFAQRRFGIGGYKMDAIGGYLNYLKPASYAIYIDPHIGKFRALKDALAEQTKDTKHLNNFIWFLNQYANGLAGKTNALDRPINDILGRKLSILVRGLNRRIKNNIILGNLSPQLAQVLNLPQSLATAGVKNNMAASWEAITNGIVREKGKDFVFENSGFIRERSRAYKKFDPTLFEKPSQLAGWIGRTLEELTTRITWGAQFRSAIERGLDKEEAIRFAERETKRVMAGRLVGDLPIAYQSQYLGNMALAFQLEVGNAILYYKDIVSEQIPFTKGWKKVLGTLVKLMVWSWAFNAVFKRMRGNKPLLDPIDAVTDALFEEDMTALERGGRLVGEFLANVPGGHYLARLYPEEGIMIPTAIEEEPIRLPTRRALFGREFAGRWGVPPVISGLTRPELIIPQVGGAQIKKTWDAWQAVKRGASVTATGRERFPIEGLADKIQALLFGQYSIPEAQEYFDELEKIDRLKRQEISERMDEAATAMAFIRDYQRVATPEERLKIFNDYKSKGLLNERVEARIKRYVKEQRKEIGVTEASLKTMSVRKRARYIINALTDMKTSQERETYLGQLHRQGLLSANVKKEINLIIEEEGFPKPPGMIKQILDFISKKVKGVEEEPEILEPEAAITEEPDLAEQARVADRIRIIYQLYKQGFSPEQIEKALLSKPDSDWTSKEINQYLGALGLRTKLPLTIRGKSKKIKVSQKLLTAAGKMPKWVERTAIKIPGIVDVAEEIGGLKLKAPTGIKIRGLPSPKGAYSLRLPAVKPGLGVRKLSI